MNNSDHCQSDPCRKQLNEIVNRNLQHQNPKDQMDNDKEAHAISSEASKQHAHEANAKQEKDDLNVMKVKSSDESEHIINPENVNVENHDSQSTARDEQVLQDPLNNSDFNIITEATSPQPVTDESTTDIEMESTDLSNGNLSEPSISSSAAEANNQSGMSDNTSDDGLKEIQKDFRIIAITENQPKEKKHQSSAERRGYSGLRNQGATCYLNAVLQTLFMTEEFRRAVFEMENEKRTKKENVSVKLQELFRCLESNKGSVSTKGITKALGIRNVCEQQDAAEYYQKILSMTEPKLAKIFQGEKKHSTTCKKGDHKSVDETNSFFSLTVSMDSDQSQINVTENFNAQFEVMLMEGEDQLFCEKCNTMKDMEMSCSILELPEVLTLHLKRFYLDYNYMTYRKNNCSAEIPLQLSAQEDSGDHHIYDLYAVVHHTGSLSGGHYYADIKSFENQQWYEFNDSMVHKIQKLDDVGHQQNHFDSDTACLLFFRKSSKQHAHEANAKQEKDDLNVMKVKSSDESEHIINPENVNVENHDSQSTARDEQVLQDPLNNSDFNIITEATSPQPVTDESTTDIEMESADLSNGNLSEPSISSSADCVIFIPEPNETANNESDNDEAEAQNSSLLEETTVSRRKIPLWILISIPLIIVCIIVFFIPLF